MKKTIIISSIIVGFTLIISVLALFYYNSNKNESTSKVDSKVEEFGENVDTAQTINSLRENASLPKSSELIERSKEHLDILDASGRFTEQTFGVKEQEEIVETKNYPYFFVAFINDRRLVDHYIYDIRVENSGDYSVMITTLPETAVEVIDYTSDEYEHEKYTGTLTDEDFIDLKRLLQSYESIHVVNEKEDKAMFYADIVVDNTNTVEETMTWVAAKLTDKQIERLDPSKGFIKTTMSFKDIQDFIEQDAYANIEQQLYDNANKPLEEAQTYEDEVVDEVEEVQEEQEVTETPATVSQPQLDPQLIWNLFVQQQLMNQLQGTTEEE